MMQHKTAPLTSSTLVASIGLALMCGVALVAIAEASAAGTVRGAADLSRTTGSAKDALPAQAGGDSDSARIVAGVDPLTSKPHRELGRFGTCTKDYDCMSGACR